jgi:hypothetical protein
MNMNYQETFEAIIADPRYLVNLDWGQPRSGHPEGTVRAHIEELERNLASMGAKLSNEEFWKLKILIHVHDAFKGEAVPGVAIADPRSHASLARSFLATRCDDADLLAMVQWHDEPYALWKQFHAKGKYNQGRFDSLLQAVKDWSLFLAFNVIDGCTEGKGRDKLRWFFGEVAGKVESRFTVADVIEAKGETP